MTRPRKQSFLHFAAGFTATWLACIALGTLIAFNWPWDWQAVSHARARTLALFGGLLWAWARGARIRITFGDDDD